MTERQITKTEQAAQPPESSKPDESIGAGTIALDFGKSLVQSAVISPLWNGVGQLVSLGHLPHVSIVNEENAKRSTADAWAQKIGNGVGVALDLVGLSAAKSLAFGRVAETEELSSMSLGARSLLQAKESAKVGAVYGAFFQESDRNGNLAWGRVANAGSNALTFGFLGGASQFAGGAVKPLLGVRPGTLANAISDMGIAGTVGMPAGVIDSVSQSALNGRPIKLDDIKQAATDYGIIGAGMAGLTHAFAAPQAARSDAPLTQEAALWKEIQSRERAFELSPTEKVMAKMFLPTSAQSDAATWRFIPEKATRLDAARLPLAITPTPEVPTALGDAIVNIKHHMNTSGEPALDYLTRSANSNDLTIIGEQHTKYGANPHRELGVELMRQLPKGSILAVELPASLKRTFEAFNKTPGSELELPSYTVNKESFRRAVNALSKIKTQYPELIDMWTAARDNGVRVVPIDAEMVSGRELITQQREGTMSKQLLSLVNSAHGKPVVAWIGNVHAARASRGPVALLAQQIAQSPEFASGARKLTTIRTQLSEPEANPQTLGVLAQSVREPVAVPSDLTTPFGQMAAYDKATAERAHSNIKASDYDALLFYPRMPAAEVQNYYRRRDRLREGAF